MTAFPFDADANLPTVSVLVAAWNEAARIEDCLASLAAIRWPNLEVLVSAGGDDGTHEIASQHASRRIAVERQRPGQGKQAALRELLTWSSSEVVYLTDGDTIVPEETFRAVLAPVVNGEAEATTGNYRPYRVDLGAPFIFYQWSIDRAVERGHGTESEGITGANAAVTRAALQAVGGFDADVKTGTDYFLARQLRAAGYRIRYVDAGVETEYAGDPRPYVRRRSRWLRNTFLHGRRLGDRAEVQNTVATMGLGMVTMALPLTLPFTKKAGGLAWAGLLALLLQRRLRYATQLTREMSLPRPRTFLLWLPFLTVLDQVSSVMALVDLASRKRRMQW